VTHKTIVIWGAGKIGRGFVADLFHAAGYLIILVDESPTLIDQLRQAGCYTVVRAESVRRREDVVIEGYTALSTAQPDEISSAVAATDILAVAVYPQDFPAVAQQLASGLVHRHEKRGNVPLDILLCTNLVHAGPRFRAMLEDAMPGGAKEYLESHVGVVETLVIRIASETPEEWKQQDPLQVWTNGHSELPVDRYAFKGHIPLVGALRLVDDMRAEETRKLYTYNTFQAALAYLGLYSGCTLTVECLSDPELRSGAEGALYEASLALQAEYGFAPDEMARWTDNVVAQTNNPVLGDTLQRLGADPRRKLRREDRLTGPALLARKHAIEPKHLVRAIAAGLRFDDPDDSGAVHVQQLITKLGLRAAVHEICGLSETESDLVDDIVQAHQRLPMEEIGIA
jgi:mannitol-1-phosphate 5-dehydrogenase